MMDATIKSLDQILKSDLKESFTTAITQRTGKFSLIKYFAYKTFKEDKT